MKYLFTIIYLLSFSAFSTAQIKVNTTQKAQTVAKVYDTKLKYYKSEGTYVLSFKDANYQQLIEFESFIIGFADDVNQTREVLLKYMDDKQNEESLSLFLNYSSNYFYL